MSKWPEHDRLEEIHEESEAIGRFLDESEYVLCKMIDDRLEPVYEPLDRILARHFKIDLDKIEAEKREMIQELSNGG